MIVRLIILIALVSLLIFAYRKLTAAKPSDSDNDNPSDAMKKCEHCGVHLPEAETCRHKDHFFCSEQHRRAYLEQHPDD